MNSYKTPGFTKAELDLVKLWAMPHVSGSGQTVNEVEETIEPIIEEDLPPVLTVEEIEAMQKQAYDEAFVQGKAEGFEQGFQQGLLDGSKQGYEENLHLLQQRAEQFETLMASLSRPFKTLDAEVENELVKLSIGIATQIIRREIKIDPGQIIATVREAINVLPLSSQKISLYLHPDDAELVRSALSLDELSSAWLMVEDPLITRGGCKVDTDISRVDATIENRLAAVIANVLGSERGTDNKDHFAPELEGASETAVELANDVEASAEEPES